MPGTEATVCKPRVDVDQTVLWERLVSQLTDFAVFVTDCDGCIQTWNPGVEHVLGYPEDEWLGHSIELIFTPEDRRLGKPQQEIENAIRGGCAPDIRWHLRRDQTRVFVEGTMVALRAEDGTLLGFSKVMRDITERKLREDELQQSEERWQTLFTSIAEGFFVGELINNEVGEAIDFRFLVVNPAFGKLTGLSDAAGKTIRELIPDIKQSLIETYAEVVRTGAPKTFEIGIPSLDHQWFEVRARKATAHQFTALFLNITERKAAAEQQTDVLHKIRESEELSRSIIESSPDCVKTLDLEGRLLTMNQVGCKLMEIDDFQTFVNQPWTGFWESAKDRAEAALLSAQQGQIDEFSALCSTAKGTPKWWDVIVAPIRDPFGQPVRILSVSRDVTDRRNDELEKERLRQELERSNEELARFAHTASHDLQSPLRGILTFAQLLQRRRKDQFDEMEAQFMDQIIGSAKRLQDLVQGLLNFAQVGHGGKETKSVDMAAVLDSALLNLKAQIEETGTVVSWDDLLPSVEGDALQLVQLLQNLIDNAVKYCPPNRQPRIHLQAQSQGSMVQFAVKDNGEGIEPEYLSKIFEPLKRLHGPDIPGTGLGLASCQRIVNRHGGQIWTESQVGVGTSFFFTLVQSTAPTAGRPQ